MKRSKKAIYLNQQPFDSNLVLTDQHLRAVVGGEMSIPEKKQKNPG